MPTHFKISMSVYPFDVMFFIGSSEREVRKFTGDWFADRAAAGGEGKFLMDEGNRSVIWLKKDWTHGVVAHEIFHAVWHICKRMGINPCRATEEVFAYMIQYLTENFYNAIDVKPS